MHSIVCDVLYYPDEDVIPHLEQGYELCSFYTERTPREFDAIFFSISFENDLVNVVRLLGWMGIQQLSEEREEEDPFLLCGGIVPTSNPESFAPIFDAIFIGEAEESLPKLVEILADSATKEATKKKLDELDFVYVPSFVEVEESGGILVPKGVNKVRSYWSDFSCKGNASCVLSEYSTFKDAYIVEVSRGCPRRCKFLPVILRMQTCKICEGRCIE